MSYNDHSHHGEYAEKYHRHYDLEDLIAGLREDLGRAEARISDLEEALHDHENAVPHAEAQ